MREFFRGWKRKVGILMFTLAVAMGACGNLTRLFHFGYSFIGGQRADTLLMKNYGFEWTVTQVPEGSKTSIQTYIPVKGSQVLFSPNHGSSERFAVHVDPKSHWRYLGFHYGQGAIPGTPLVENVATFPYWPALLSFSLLSAYLLLSKPRLNTLRESPITTAI